MNRTILRYQELATNAWPARTYMFLNGWVLRLSEGVTKRANSVLPLRYTGEDVAKDIRTVEELYRENGLPAIFQLPDYFEPRSLQKTLRSLGYRSTDETLVMAAHVEGINAAMTDRYTYCVEDKGSDRWFQALSDFSNESDEAFKGRKAIIDRIILSKGFFCAWKDDTIVGIGLGTIEKEYMGIYSFAVHPECRRKGIGQSLVAVMIQWAKERSVTYVYLQVHGGNSEAISLYEKTGFRELYHYRYFVL